MLCVCVYLFWVFLMGVAMVVTNDDDVDNDDSSYDNVKLKSNSKKPKRGGGKTDNTTKKKKAIPTKAAKKKNATTKATTTTPKSSSRTKTATSASASKSKQKQAVTPTKGRATPNNKKTTRPPRSAAAIAATKKLKTKRKLDVDDDDDEMDDTEHHTLHGKRKQGGKKKGDSGGKGHSNKKRKIEQDSDDDGGDDVEMTEKAKKAQPKSKKGPATTATNAKPATKKGKPAKATSKHIAKASKNDSATPNDKKEESKEVLKNGNKEEDDVDDDDDKSDDSEPEAAACCLCHCGMDCSDRALFFRHDRQREIQEVEQDSDIDDYYFTMDDPYLPMEFYDKNNALVYCDTCNRLYHQKCHFVPLLVVPHGKQKWECLLCTYQKLLLEHNKHKNQKKKSPSKKNTKHKKHPPTQLSSVFDDIPVDEQLTRKQCSQLYMHEPLPPSSQSSGSVDKVEASPMAITTPNGNNGKDDPANAKVTKDSALPAEILQEVEQKFELSSRKIKAMVLQQQLKQMEKYINSQFGKIHQAQATLDTLTSTKRNRQHFMQRSKYNSKASQELAQTILRMASAKLKIKECLDSLESIRVLPTTSTAPPIEQVLLGDDDNDDGEEDDDGHKKFLRRRLQDWCRENPKLAEHVFPFGVEQFVRRQRHVPRTQEMKKNNVAKKKKEKEAEVGVPSEVVVPSSSKKTNDSAQSKNKKDAKSKDVTQSSKQKDSGAGDDDDDSGISLDDLQCCVCFIGDASDDNDVLLCDGDGCYRAYHMKCVRPEIAPDDISEDEDDDWFCPICSALGHLLNQVQSRYMGDEWEQRRLKGKDDSSSLKSWVHAKDVFPDVDWEFTTAEQLKKGIDSAETRKLLVRYVGEDFHSNKKKKYRRPEPQSDDEDEEDYSLFDENSFEERKRKEREEEAAAKRSNKNQGDDDDQDDSDDEDHDDESLSTRSSQATLVEMSSVELNIGKAELAALSSDDDDDSDAGNESGKSDGSGKNMRRSRRLRKMYEASSDDESEDGSSSDSMNGADFDERNIVQGKRRRTKVDYRKLNDALFGDLTERERAQIDDKDDFKVKAKRKGAKRKSNASSDDDSSGEDNKNRRKRRRKSKEETDSNNESSGDDGSGSDDGSNNDDSEDGDGSSGDESSGESN